MLLGDSLLDNCQRASLTSPNKRRRVDAIAGEAFGSAVLQPIPYQPPLSGQQPKQDFLMVSGKEIGLEPIVAVSAQPFHHAPAVWAAVDQVTQKDHQCLMRWPAFRILLDGRQNAVEQVQAAVNIAHGIGAVTARRLRRSILLFASAEHQKP